MVNGISIHGSRCNVRASIKNPKPEPETLNPTSRRATVDVSVVAPGGSFPNRGPKYRHPKYYNPYYEDPRKVHNFGKPQVAWFSCFRDFDEY